MVSERHGTRDSPCLSCLRRSSLVLVSAMVLVIAPHSPTKPQVHNRKDYRESKRRSPAVSAQSSTVMAPGYPTQLTVSFEVTLYQNNGETCYVETSVFDLPPELILLLGATAGATEVNPNPNPEKAPVKAEIPVFLRKLPHPRKDPRLPLYQKLFQSPSPFDGLIQRMLDREWKIAELEARCAEMQAQQAHQITGTWERGGRVTQ